MPIMHSLYREAGRVSVDTETCTRCGACVKICPGDVLSMASGRVAVREDSPLGCVACGHCMMVCPSGAVAVTGRGLSPADVAPLPDPATRADADALAALMRSRRSVRHFSERDVEPEVLARVEELASTAPMGIPPWDVGCVRVAGREQVQRVAAGVIKGYVGFLKMFQPWVLAVMRLFVGRAKHEFFTQFVRPLALTYVQSAKEGRDRLFYDAPALLIFHHSPYADPVDAAIACTYAMLAAESMGLGSTMIGGAPPILQRDRALCRSLGIPDGNTPSAALILGYPATHFRKTIRRRFL